MPLQGHQWKPRDVARLLYDEGWLNAQNLCLMVATVGAESDYYEQAWNWNDPSKGGDGSTDWGIFELNDGNVGGGEPDAQGSPRAKPGAAKTVAEVTEFRDVAWTPRAAVKTARSMYSDRGFQPWAAYNSGAYKKHLRESCIAVCNFLAVLNGLAPIV